MSWIAGGRSGTRKWKGGPKPPPPPEPPGGKITKPKSKTKRSP